MRKMYEEFSEIADFDQLRRARNRISKC